MNAQRPPHLILSLGNFSLLTHILHFKRFVNPLVNAVRSIHFVHSFHSLFFLFFSCRSCAEDVFLESSFGSVDSKAVDRGVDALGISYDEAHNLSASCPNNSTASDSQSTRKVQPQGFNPVVWLASLLGGLAAAALVLAAVVWQARPRGCL